MGRYIEFVQDFVSQPPYSDYDHYELEQIQNVASSPPTSHSSYNSEEMIEVRNHQRQLQQRVQQQHQRIENVQVDICDFSNERIPEILEEWRRKPYQQKCFDALRDKILIDQQKKIIKEFVTILHRLNNINLNFNIQSDRNPN